MKRLLVGTLVAAAIAAPLVAHDASAAGLKKPKKVDAKTLVVTGGSPWPLGFGSGLFGVVDIAFPTPTSLVADAPFASTFTVTCTPYYKGGVVPTNAPTEPNTKSFTGYTSSYASTVLSTPGYSKVGTTIHLQMDQYSDTVAEDASGADVFPSLLCKVDATNATGTTAGKAPKLPTSPAANCTDLANEYSIATNPLIIDPVVGVGQVTVGNGVTIDAGDLSFGYCSTDDERNAKFLTDNATIFKSSTKVKYKAAKGAVPAVRHATVKKLILDSPVNSPIPLTTSGSTVVYHFDPDRLQVVSAAGVVGNAGCVVAAAKTVGKVNSCAVNNTLGTITITSNDVGVVKVGKDIVSAALTVDFNYTAGADTSLTFVYATTAITIGATTVDVKVQSNTATYSSFGLPVEDPNYNFPIVTLTGLL